MPVIQLPKDDRWGQLGAGLGNVIGSALTAYQDKQTAAGVAEIMQDPNVPDSNKPAKILKDFGDRGYEHYKKLIQTQVFQKQMDHITSQIGRETVLNKLDEARLPFAAKKEQVGIEHTAQQTAASQALTPAEVALKGASAENLGAETATKQALLPGAAGAQGALTDERRQSAGKTALESQVIQNQLDTRRALGAVDNTFETQLKPFGLTEDQKAGARQEYNAGESAKPGGGYTRMIDYAVKMQTQNQKHAEIKPAPVDERKTASSDIAHATSAMRFVDEFANKGGAERIGMFKGAPAIALLEKWGVATGDSQIISMINSSKQQVQSMATSGGGFFAQGRVKLAQDVTPAVTETPLHAIITMDEVADRKLAELKTNLSGFEGTQINTKPFEKAIAEWEKVKAITGTLQSDIVPDARYLNDPRSGRTVMFFMGNQIDPKSFKPLVKNDASLYTISGGRKIPGTMLFEMSKPPTGPDDNIHKNKDPAQILKELGGRL